MDDIRLGQANLYINKDLYHAIHRVNRLSRIHLPPTPTLSQAMDSDL